jgi:hypothetical protein
MMAFMHLYLKYSGKSSLAGAVTPQSRQPDGVEVLLQTLWEFVSIEEISRT